MRENKTCLCKEFAEMSTAQLDEKLQQELQKEEPEAEVVLGILGVLEEREADAPVVITQEISDAWETYRERTAPKKKTARKRIWLAGVAAAAVICMVILAIPQRVGAESIFDVFFRWTESIFEFFSPDENKPKPPAEYVFQTEHPGLQQIYDEVTALGVTKPIVPMWVPEDCALKELKVIRMPDGNKVHVVLQSDGNAIILAYRISENIIASKFEKEDPAVETYECAEVQHFIMENDENISVTWTVGGAECSISTDLEKEDIYKLIKSIYKGGLS